MSDELGLPDGVYQYVYRMCFLHPINIYAGFYYGHRIGGTMGIILFGSSINYWRYPLLKSKRRTFDMCVANICVPYHIYISFYTKNKLLCSGTLLAGVSMYPISFLCSKYNKKIGGIFHCLLHLFVILGATFTYRDYYLQSISA
jgi:hypothetical protein